VSESAGFTVDGCSAIIEAVKKAEEGDALVVRLYDAEKIRRRVTVSAPFSVRRVVECTMLERPKRPLKVTRNRWSFPLAPFEIKTFKVYP
jgi:alpha-mannosidase